MKIKLDEGAFMPKREHKTDAGMDIRAIKSGIVRAHSSATFHTGVHVELPEGTTGILLPKSGLMCGHDILTFGVIDESYRGEIMVHMFNLGNDDYFVHAGDKISQMLVVDVRYEDVELVDELSDSDRGNDGFGSTGR